jgi:phosphohistidine phosphatase
VGTKDITQVAEWFEDLDMKFDVIITSPLKRAHQTASIVAKIFNIENKLNDWHELQPESNRIELYRKLSSQQFSVGHEPYLSSLISEIISEAGSSSRSVLKKAGLAKISITSHSSKYAWRARVSTYSKAYEKYFQIDAMKQHYWMFSMYFDVVHNNISTMIKTKI